MTQRTGDARSVFTWSAMIDDSDLERIVQALPILRHAPHELLRAFQAWGFLTRIPAGRDVFVEGQQVGAIPLLISGTVRVYQIGETGRAAPRTCDGLTDARQVFDKTSDAVRAAIEQAKQ